MSKLVIDCLSFHEEKQFSYRVYIRNLIDYFFQNRPLVNFEVIILVFDISQKKYFEKYVSKFVLKGYKFNNTVHKYLIQSDLPRSLNLVEQDLILFPGNYTSWSKKCKQLLVIHDLAFLHNEVMNSVLMRLQRKTFTPISLKNADRIVAISDFTRRELIESYKVDQAKISVIYNHFNFEKFLSYQKFDQPIYSYFISVCSSAPYKNSITLLKAFNIYCLEKGSFHLVVVGALDSSNKECFKYYQSLPPFVREKIHIYSHISDTHLGSLYKNASAFISATLYEGLGMPIVEAMYHGIPAILSDLSICREVSLNLAYYFESYDFMKLKELMAMCEMEPTVKRNYSNQISQVYSSQNTVAKYIEIINLLYEE